MSISRSILFIALPALVFIAGCKKAPKAPGPTVYYFSATSATIGSFYVTGKAVLAGKTGAAKISVSAETTSGRSVLLYINSYAGTTDVFPIKGGYAGLVYRSAAGDTTLSTTSGTISITGVSPDLMGTFNCIASDGSTLTGSFVAPAP